MTELTALRPSYRKLSALKADFVRLAVLYTDGGRQSVDLLDSLAADYVTRFSALAPDAAESPAELPALVYDLLAAGRGKLALEFRGSQLWVSNGTYGNGKQYRRATYEARHYLKAHGLRWSPNHEAWYYKRPAASPAA
ncbi:MAG: hypothetical protein LUG45_05235 [Clostridiales bacterium]|nr:hypothetical protein [Clostridiales bacterium]